MYLLSLMWLYIIQGVPRVMDILRWYVFCSIFLQQLQDWAQIKEEALSFMKITKSVKKD